MRTARVSISIVLAVHYSALHSLLNLTDTENLERQPGSGSSNPNPPLNFSFLRSNIYLSAQDAVHHDDDETLQRVEDGEENLKEGRAAVCDGQDGRHPGEGQEGQNHAGAPQ